MKRTLDLTNFRELQEDVDTVVLTTYQIRLDKKTILDALQSEVIYINGIHYEVPETQLLKVLIDKRFGQVELILKEIIKL